jgi:hypothetical protein
MSEPVYAYVLCPDHGQSPLTFKEYVKQLSCPDSKWTCPICGKCAGFNDQHFHELHGRSGLTSQECSKLEHTYTHAEVRDMVSSVMRYVDDLENAIVNLGKPDAIIATIKAQTSRWHYQESIRPFQHLRSK